jgi:hypothetical protein
MKQIAKQVKLVISTVAFASVLVCHVLSSSSI